VDPLEGEFSSVLFENKTETESLIWKEVNKCAGRRKRYWRETKTA
jgi:hypothetical protein